MAKVFISYSRKDTEFARRLTAELQKCDLDYWIDWEGIAPTVDWWKEIEKGIEEADAFLFVISPDSIQSKVCGMEIDYASKMGKRLIPLLCRKIESSDAPAQLKDLHWLFFLENEDFDKGTQALLTTIHTDYEWVKAHRRLQMRALEWENGFKDNSLLLRGKDLKEAQKQLKANSNKDPFPTELQKQYVHASRKIVNRQRWMLALGVFTLAMFICLFITALAQRGSAITAQAGARDAFASEKIRNASQTAVIARLLSSDDSIDSAISPLLAVYSLQRHPNDIAREILRSYLEQNSKLPASSDEELIVDACAILPRNLTKAEWATYISGDYEIICSQLPAE